MPAMNEIIERRFGFIGARARLIAAPATGRVTIDVRRHRDREHFELRLPNTASAAVLDADKSARHLLAFRRGGTTVYVSRVHPTGLTQEKFDALSDDDRRKQSWRQMVRDASVFAKGRIRHADHATLVLREWNQVFMNTEPGARAMRHVAFLD